MLHRVHVMAENSGKDIAAPGTRPSRLKRLLFSAAGLALLAGGAAAIVVRRGVPLPKPTGPFSVGRTSRHLVDRSRPEVFTEDADDHRELMIAIHFPAASSDGLTPARYLDAQAAAGFAEALEVPEFVIQAARPHALEGAAVYPREAGFPVLLFSHGFGQPPLFYTATLEELASHGFIVVSINHTYSSGISVFSDGRVALQNEAASHPEASFEVPDEQDEESSPDDVGSVWVKDLRFVLDELTSLDRDDNLLAGRMDLAKVGVFGHSFGGAAAVRAVQLDSRFLAAINLDGMDLGATTTAAIERPVLWLTATPQEPTDAQLQAVGQSRAWYREQMQKYAERGNETLKQAPRGRRMRIREAGHQTFTSDLVIANATWPWNRFTRGLEVGTISAGRAVALVNRLTLGFFREHLQGQADAAWPSGADGFPEVEEVAVEADSVGIEG